MSWTSREEGARSFDPAARSFERKIPVAAFGDRRDGYVYVYPERAPRAVKVALATGRPILIRGSPGSGKSSLAPHVARCLGWRYYEVVVTSRTQARDLLWSFDAVKRLSDAQANKAKPEIAYVEPGVLWWAMAPDKARCRGVKGALPQEVGEAVEPRVAGFPYDAEAPAVVLVDEIDKADPDVPNDLLVALGSYRFAVAGLTEAIEATHLPLLVITSNDERELPLAFRRRCIDLFIESPGREQLLAIARAHFGEEDAALHEEIAELTIKAIAAAKEAIATPAGARAPSTAEFIDAIRACKGIGVDAASHELGSIASIALKQQG
jgi:MoxR-like ATPase